MQTPNPTKIKFPNTRKLKRNWSSAGAEKINLIEEAYDNREFKGEVEAEPEKSQKTLKTVRDEIIYDLITIYVTGQKKSAFKKR